MSKTVMASTQCSVSFGWSIFRNARAVLPIGNPNSVLFDILDLIRHERLDHSPFINSTEKKTRFLEFVKNNSGCEKMQKPYKNMGYR